MNTKEKTRTINLRGIDPDLFRRFKSMCAREGISMSKQLMNFIEIYLNVVEKNKVQEQGQGQGENSGKEAD